MIAGKNIWTRFFNSFHIQQKPTRRYRGLSVRFIVDRPGFDSLVESSRRHQNSIHCFLPDAHHERDRMEKKPEILLVVLFGKALNKIFFISMWQTGSEAEDFTHRCGQV